MTSCVAGPGLTVKLPDAFVRGDECRSRAVIVRLLTPAIVGVMEIPSTNPPELIVAGTLTEKAFEVRVTVPM